MHKDERDLLEVLKFELEFLEKGGYGHSPREPWRPQFIFEDSPTCMNYDSKAHPDPCEECVLMQLVPPEYREAKTPCRHIPFNAEGETLESLYRYTDQYETEEIFGNWLRTTVAKLEADRQAHRDDSKGRLTASPSQNKAEPLFQTLHPKCANPACPTPFHWLGGGRFLRFRANSSNACANQPKDQTVSNLHSVKHYWLCERCSHVFTLVYDESAGVVLRSLWSQLPAGEPPKQLRAT